MYNIHLIDAIDIMCVWHEILRPNRKDDYFVLSSNFFWLTQGEENAIKWSNFDR